MHFNLHIKNSLKTEFLACLVTLLGTNSIDSDINRLLIVLMVYWWIIDRLLVVLIEVAVLWAGGSSLDMRQLETLMKFIWFKKIKHLKKIAKKVPE